MMNEESQIEGKCGLSEKTMFNAEILSTDTNNLKFKNKNSDIAPVYKTTKRYVIFIEF